MSYFTTFSLTASQADPQVKRRKALVRSVVWISWEREIGDFTEYNLVREIFRQRLAGESRVENEGQRKLIKKMDKI